MEAPAFTRESATIASAPSVLSRSGRALAQHVIQGLRIHGVALRRLGFQHLPNESEGDEPPAGDQNQRDTLLELCFRHSVAPIIGASGSYCFQAVCMIAGDVLCGPRDYQAALFNKQGAANGDSEHDIVKARACSQEVRCRLQDFFFRCLEQRTTSRFAFVLCLFFCWAVAVGRTRCLGCVSPGVGTLVSSHNNKKKKKQIKK